MMDPSRSNRVKWLLTAISRCVEHQRVVQFLLASWLVLTASNAQAGWRAGVAKKEITPSVGLWMAGYAHRDHPAEGTLTELWAKALVLEDDAGNRGVIVTLDLIGVDREFTRQLTDKLMAAYNLQRQQVVICTSHTHTGPVVSRNLESMHYAMLDADQQSKLDEYAQELQENIVGVVGSATASMFTADVVWGSGSAAFAVNRRANPEPQVPELRVTNRLQGPIDHTVPVLAIQDDEGRFRAVLFGYACHLTVLSSYEWSGDYAGYAQMTLERDYPGCVAMFWAGCGGDQNPLPRRQVELAQQYGIELAGAVKQVLETELTPVTPQLVAHYHEIDLPFSKLPDEDEVRADTQSKDRFVAARARLLLQQLEQGQPLSRTYPYPIETWRLGSDIQFVFLGGEVVVDYALRLKSELSDKHTWVAAYANDVMAYIPSRRVLREGGYEGGGAMVYYGLPAPWAPDIERLIVDQVHRQLEAKGSEASAD